MILALNGRQAMRASSFPKRLAAFTSLLILANIGAWTWTLTEFYNQPVLLTTALLAYGLGLRHAFDADHIAAIDNVTRKLMQEGQRPFAVGFFFAIGHSTVVALAVVAVVSSTTLLFVHQEKFVEVSNVLGTITSALFLLTIAFANLQSLRITWQHLRSARRGAVGNADSAHVAGGLLSCLLSPLFRMVRGSWQMYLIGFLFALGFDTATEVALLGISATQAAAGLSLWSVLSLPALFAAGMSLVDTANGVLMLGAYNWSFPRSIRTLHCNLVITVISIVIAVAIGGIQLLRLIGDWFALSGKLWDTVGVLSENFNVLGFVIVGVFSLVWVGFVVIYHYLGANKNGG